MMPVLYIYQYKYQFMITVQDYLPIPFVARRFGLGYKLTLVKASDQFEPDSLTSLVLSHVTNAELLSSAGGEISFRLPREESGKFPGLFRDLEAGREVMGVGGYGVSITSLEEVFLSLEKEGKLADFERGTGSTGFRGAFRGGEGGSETVLDGSRRNGTNGGDSSSGGGAGGFQGAGRLRQRRDSRAGGGAGAGVGGNGKGKSNAGWGETRTGRVQEIEMQSLTARASRLTSNDNLDAVGSAENAHEAATTGSGKDIRRNGTSNGKISTNGNHHAASNSGSGSGSSSGGNRGGGGVGGSNGGGRVDESYHSNGRYADDEEDLASLLAETQEDDQDATPSTKLGPDYGESDTATTVTGGGGGRRRLGREYSAGFPGEGGLRSRWKGTVSRFWEQLCWLLWKRKVVAARDWRGGVYQVFLPAALVALVLVLLTIDVGLAGPSLAMSAAMFGSPTEVGRGMDRDGDGAINRSGDGGESGGWGQ